MSIIHKHTTNNEGDRKVQVEKKNDPLAIIIEQKLGAERK